MLTITEALRKKGVVGKFVEFFGAGLEHLTIADRATIGNMCPEYGATVAIFPIDDMTLDYLRLTGREAADIALVEAYARAQGMFRTDATPDAEYTDTLSSISATRRAEPGGAAAAAGPRAADAREGVVREGAAGSAEGREEGRRRRGGARRREPRRRLEHGSVVIAAITSCTNTSNPSVMIGAGSLAKKAVEPGSSRKPWVKTSLAPGSKVVTEYLAKAGLQPSLDALGFNLVGYGCTTCIGNSGPLPDEIAADVREHGLVVCAVLSGNRNFEGRIQQDVRANYLASPPLVVAYALAGSMNVDITTEPLGTGKDGKPVFLKDIWPTEAEVQQSLLSRSRPRCSASSTRRSSTATSAGRSCPCRPATASRGRTTRPTCGSRRSSRASRASRRRSRTSAARACWRVLGDSITTDHISPAGSIKADSPAGKYLVEHGVAVEGLQLVRRAARQSRGDDARHVRQRAAAQRARARHRRRLDDLAARRRRDDDLRRVDEVPRRGRRR